MRGFRVSVILFAALLAACSDSSTTLPKLNVGGSGIARSRATAIDNLIVQLYPRGIETATGSRWDRIDTELGTWDATTGQWTGTSADQGRKHTLDLIKFIQMKSGDIEASGLAAGETRTQAASRLIAAMTAYVLGGPDATIPPPGADVVVAVVPAGSAATIVTPSEHAGVSIPAGATNEERVIVVSQTAATGFAARCSGPLDYTGCQYPLFYQFESLPHLKLNTAGHFAVCIDFTSPNAPTESEHERVRLAHDLPANAADYTPGAEQVQGIEILPLSTTQQDFLDCDQPAPPPVIGFEGFMKRGLYELAELGAKVFSPKKLYAYDQGPEHDSFFFSNFNAVDPVLACDGDCPAPILELRSITSDNGFTTYNLQVKNSSAYSDAMFVASPSLPACGDNTSSSRTWVDIYTTPNNSRVYGFCALGSANDMNSMWFSVPTDATQPEGVYIKLVDRLTNSTYTSNTVSLVPIIQ